MLTLSRKFQIMIVFVSLECLLRCCNNFVTVSLAWQYFFGKSLKVKTGTLDRWMYFSLKIRCTELLLLKRIKAQLFPLSLKRYNILIATCPSGADNSSSIGAILVSGTMINASLERSKFWTSLTFLYKFSALSELTTVNWQSLSSCALNISIVKELVFDRGQDSFPEFIESSSESSNKTTLKSIKSDVFLIMIIYFNMNNVSLKIICIHHFQWLRKKPKTKQSNDIVSMKLLLRFVVYLDEKI